MCIALTGSPRPSLSYMAAPISHFKSGDPAGTPAQASAAKSSDPLHDNAGTPSKSTIGAGCGAGGGGVANNWYEASGPGQKWASAPAAGSAPVGPAPSRGETTRTANVPLAAEVMAEKPAEASEVTTAPVASPPCDRVGWPHPTLQGTARPTPIGGAVPADQPTALHCRVGQSDAHCRANQTGPHFYPGALDSLRQAAECALWL